MSKNRKVVYTFYTDRNDANHINKLSTDRNIRIAVLAADENMAQWARELKVSRQFVYQVIKGVRKTRRIRDFIESRLGTTFWPKDESRRKS
jgi:predicted DNA-binding protein YlxM (UPF0122 family)